MLKKILMWLALVGGPLISVNAVVAVLWSRSATLLELLLSAAAALAGTAMANVFHRRRQRRYRSSIKDSALW